jgi:hypothetical protein
MQRPRVNLPTAPGRAAFNEKFLKAAGGDPIKTEHLRQAHYAAMALASGIRHRRSTRLVTR